MTREQKIQLNIETNDYFASIKTWKLEDTANGNVKLTITSKFTNTVEVFVLDKEQLKMLYEFLKEVQLNNYEITWRAFMAHIFASFTKYWPVIWLIIITKSSNGEVDTIEKFIFELMKDIALSKIVGEGLVNVIYIYNIGKIIVNKYVPVQFDEFLISLKDFL